jgi:hypothetical protein
MQAQDTLVAAKGALISQLQVEVADLKRRLSQDSSNSSTPPSADSTAPPAIAARDISLSPQSKDR